jgi:gamma-glutamylcyclotransferase (GGCT)/AIG2-like uncharacterized protein YtfP
MTSHTVYNLFVYGSLRKGFQSNAYEYISRFFTLVGNARVKGRLVDMGTYPAGVPVEGEHYIIGELYQIKNSHEFSWAMGQLDDYEGVNAESEEERHYQRAVTDVYCNDMVLQAWIYWYHGDTSGRPVIESGDMLQYLQDKQ